MLTALQAAAVIAATAFAVLAIAGVYALVKLARLISAATGAVADFRVRGDLLAGRANSAVERAHEQLTRTDAITANMDEVAANIAELTTDVSMLSGAVHTLLGGPLGRLAAFSFGVRRAIALRRGTEPERLPRMRRPLVRGERAGSSPRGGTEPGRPPAALPAPRVAAPDHEGRPQPGGQGRPGPPGRRVSGRRVAR